MFKIDDSEFGEDDEYDDEDDDEDQSPRSPRRQREVREVDMARGLPPARGERPGGAW